MDRKHLMDLIKFSENAKEADERIRQHTGIETVGAKKAFLKGMFDCLDDFEATGTDEECYEQYLKHIISINSVEEKIVITQEIGVKVRYQKNNRHGTRVFSVYVKNERLFWDYGMLYLNSNGMVRIETMENMRGDTLYRELEEKIKEAFPVERLLRICKKNQ